MPIIIKFIYYYIIITNKGQYLIALNGVASEPAGFRIKRGDFDVKHVLINDTLCKAMGSTRGEDFEY